MINKFADRLNELIKCAGITKYLLSKNTGISKSTMTEYCKGTVQPTADVIITIAAYFGVSTDYLLGVENEYGEKENIINSFNNNSGTINFKK